MIFSILCRIAASHRVYPSSVSPSSPSSPSPSSPSSPSSAPPSPRRRPRPFSVDFFASPRRSLASSSSTRSSSPPLRPRVRLDLLRHLGPVSPLVRIALELSRRDDAAETVRVASPQSAPRFSPARDDVLRPVVPPRRSTPATMAPARRVANRTHQTTPPEFFFLGFVPGWEAPRRAGAPRRTPPTSPPASWARRDLRPARHPAGTGESLQHRRAEHAAPSPAKPLCWSIHSSAGASCVDLPSSPPSSR